jgi:hypothetical protein
VTRFFTALQIATNAIFKLFFWRVNKLSRVAVSSRGGTNIAHRQQEEGQLPIKPLKLRGYEKFMSLGDTTLSIQKKTYDNRILVSSREHYHARIL